MSLYTHRPPYSVSGQDGKSIGAHRRTLAEIGALNATLEFSSQDADELRFSIRGNLVPEYGQEFSLFDATGERVFTGNVTRVDPQWTAAGAQYDITVSGPWWWLEQAQLTGLVTGADSEKAEVASFLLPTQDIALSITSIITRMQALGVPLEIGSIDPTFTVPQMILQGTSAAVALRDVLGFIPDATTTVSYNTNGLPRLNVHRRPSMDTTVFSLGSDGCTAAATILQPRRELRPTSVEVQSITLDSAGEVVYSRQIAGDTSGISGVLGKQLVSISGPGRRDFRERPIRKINVQTMHKTFIQSIFYAKHAGLAELQRVYSAQYWELMTTTATITVPTGSGYRITTYPPKNSWNIDGVANASSFNVLPYVVVSDKLPDWWQETPVPQRQTVKIAARFIVGFVSGDPATADHATLSTFSHSVSGGDYYFADLEVEAEAISTDYATSTLIIHPLDAAIVQPVADLANNLYDAQNWLSHDGSLSLIPGGSIPTPARAVSVANAFPEWEHARALLSSTSVDLRTGSANLRLGSPARQTGSSLLNRFQRSTRGEVIGL